MASFSAPPGRLFQINEVWYIRDQNKKMKAMHNWSANFIKKFLTKEELQFCFKKIFGIFDFFLVFQKKKRQTLFEKFVDVMAKMKTKQNSYLC